MKDRVYWRCPHCSHSYKWKWNEHEADHDAPIVMQCDDSCKRETKGRMYRVGEARYAVIFAEKMP
jgi:phage terminase large subunit GpA-like protein